MTVLVASFSDIAASASASCETNLVYNRLTTPQDNADSSSFPASVEQIVRQSAYEFYEKRGREDGHAVEDWLCAEAEVLISTVSRMARVG